MQKDPQFLTESEAWEDIANRIENGDWDCLGLCAEVQSLYDFEWISFETYADMVDRITYELHDRFSGGTVWLFPSGEAAPRIALACRFAKEAQEIEAILATPVVE